MNPSHVLLMISILLVSCKNNRKFEDLDLSIQIKYDTKVMELQTAEYEVQASIFSILSDLWSYEQMYETSLKRKVGPNYKYAVVSPLRRDIRQYNKAIKSYKELLNEIYGFQKEFIEQGIEKHLKDDNMSTQFLPEINENMFEFELQEINDYCEKMKLESTKKDSLANQPISEATQWAIDKNRKLISKIQNDFSFQYAFRKDVFPDLY